jgi:transposase
LPPWQTVHWYFDYWEQTKVTEKILPVVRTQLRVQVGRNPEPSAGVDRLAERERRRHPGPAAGRHRAVRFGVAAVTGGGAT